MAEGTAVVVVKPKIDLDIKLGVSELTDIAISEMEEQYFKKQESLEKELAAAVKQHGQAEKDLSKQGFASAKKIKVDDKSKALVAALNGFSGKKGQYEAGITVKEEDNHTNVKEAKVKVLVKITNNEHYNKSTEFSREVSVDFTSKMKGMVKHLEKKAKAVKKLQGELNDVRKAVANLPRMERQMKASVARGLFTGEITLEDCGKQLMDAVDGVKRKALPAS